MESPEMPGSPTEYEDEGVYPCKGCGEILEEGKAFELANNRWHIDCFRCNTCGTLLDSDANLLLLADGSLICNSCTYSCTACGNKIEDLAILTGDQAFCAGCFRCRNCKRKIENLRYARTSQGIFCMSCHESLMARRKKKQKSSRQAAGGGGAAASPLAMDKALPAIPQDMDRDDGLSVMSETPTELSPRPVPRPPPAPPLPVSRTLNNNNSNNAPSIRSNKTPEQLSPAYAETHGGNQRMPRAYNNNRHSQIYHPVEIPELSAGDQSEPYTSLIPLVFDSSPPVSSQTTPYHRHDNPMETAAPPPRMETAIPPPRTERPLMPRTYSNSSEAPSEYERDKPELVGRKPVPNSISAALQQPPPPPHIAFQERGRQQTASVEMLSETERKGLDKKPTTGSLDVSPYPSRTSSRAAGADLTMAISPGSKMNSTEVRTPDGTQKRDPFKLGEVPRERKKSISSIQQPAKVEELSSAFSPSRVGQSLTYGQVESPQSQAGSSKHESSMDDVVAASKHYNHNYSHSVSGSNSSGNNTDMNEINTNNIPRKEVPNRIPTAPERSQTATDSDGGNNYSPSLRLSQPQTHGHRISQSENLTAEHSPLFSLLKTPAISEFGMEKEIMRVLGGDYSDSSSLIRKVSNAVRHGRSFSDITVTSESKDKDKDRDENSALQMELRRSTMRIAELELKLNHNHTNPDAEFTKIEEQKSVVAGLESAREARIRELEILAAGKEGQDFETFRKDSIRNLAKELEDLRNSYEAQIQALSIQRNTLLEENAQLTRIRDQTVQDTEQLNLKNAQLMDLNNEITKQIQARFQSHKGTPSNASNHMMHLDGGITGDQHGRPPTATTQVLGTTIHSHMHDTGDDDDVIIAQPTIVNVGRKGGYIKKSWKKGGAAIIKGAGKGFNKVFSTEHQGQQQQQDGFQATAYGQTAIAGALPQTDSLGGSYVPRSQTMPDPHGGFDKIFGTQKFKKSKTGLPNGGNGSGNYSTVNSSGILVKDEITLFGTTLEARAMYEGRSIPYVVSRCIQEVEARGMDFEGIYRKSGGASSMRQIQDSFERGEELDIGDSVDICGVTSVLKQYFRKLPIPIITPTIYDDFLRTNKIGTEAERTQEIKQVMSQLPSVHQDVLGYVIFHLRKVAEKEPKNKMTPRNLAVVFAPTLMWHDDSEREMHDMHEKNTAIQFLIEHSEEIFFS